MKQKPNVLFIQADQHRYDCVGRSADYPVITPHLDRLAAEGAWFNHAYTPIPLCCPARQALLNGRRPEVFGALWNYDNGLPIPALSPAEYSWPRQLQQSGYNTAYFGKWHVNPKHGPEEYGFEHTVLDQEHNRFIQHKYGKLAYSNGFFGEPSPVPLEDTHTHYMTAKCIEWLKETGASGDPWHVRLDFHAPHLPCRPAEPFASMYKPEEIPMWRSFGETFDNKPYIQKQMLRNWNIERYTWKDWAHTVALYYGFVSQVDHAVGQVLEMLDEAGLRENTIVVYTSDHGDMCGGHRMLDKHYVLYDDVVKVPLIVRWPGVIDENTSCEQFVYNMLDLPPTLLEAAGLQAPDFMQGRSLLPLFRNEISEPWREYVMSTFNGQQFGLYIQRMLRTKHWKYIWNPTDVDELYDLTCDPEELHNRIHDPNLADLIKDFRKNLYEELKRVGDKSVDGQWLRRQLIGSEKY